MRQAARHSACTCANGVTGPFAPSAMIFARIFPALSLLICHRCRQRSGASACSRIPVRTYTATATHLLLECGWDKDVAGRLKQLSGA